MFITINLPRASINNHRWLIKFSSQVYTKKTYDQNSFRARYPDTSISKFLLLLLILLSLLLSFQVSSPKICFRWYHIIPYYSLMIKYLASLISSPSSKIKKFLYSYLKYYMTFLLIGETQRLQSTLYKRFKIKSNFKIILNMNL